MKRMYSNFLLIILLLATTAGFASPTSNYFRVWQGFKKTDLSTQEFMDSLPSFMDETVSLYENYNALNNYIVVIPPKNKPEYVPDELALVGLKSEEIYREIRQTPEGKSYSERHWDVFNKETSSSAKTFINYPKEEPEVLTNNTAYDMFGKKIDWSSGYNLVYIGLRKNGLNSVEFLQNLKNHIELAKNVLGPKGLRGYIVIANEKYEVAYINWVSKKAFEQAGSQQDTSVVFEDADRFMDKLMFEEVKTYSANDPVNYNSAYSTRETAMKQKILIVVTSHNKLGNTGKPTGYYLPEVTRPYFELEKTGLEIDIASPLGGKAPMDPSSKDLTDPANRRFLERPELVGKIENTIALEEINPREYTAILFAGGHGTMWDFADSKDINRITSQIFENNGVVAAVCHGPAALVNVKLSNGKYLVSGKRVTGFSNAEEDAAQLTNIMPFLLETTLVERNAKYEHADLWQKKVVTDGRLVTGQNPASAAGVGEEMAKLLSAK